MADAMNPTEQDLRQREDRRGQMWEQYMRLYIENSAMDRQRIPAMQGQLAEVVGSVGRIEQTLVKFDKIIMGNGEPEKGMVTRMTLLEKAVAALGGADAWRKNLIAVALTGVLTSVTTAFLVAKLIIK